MNKINKKRPAAFLTLILWLGAGVCLWGGDPDFDGKIIEKIDFLADGPLDLVSQEDMTRLILLQEGDRYTASAAKISLQRLYSSQIFHDVQVAVSPGESPQAVVVTFYLLRRYTIEDVQFQGDRKIDRQILQRQLALSPGQAYSDLLVEGAVSRLQETYQRHGFYQARIRPQFEVKRESARLQLIFHIEPGAQARLGQLQIEAEEPGRESIQNLIRVRKRQPFSEVELETDIEIVERNLAVQGYLRATVSRDIRYDPSDNTVAVTLKIVPGEKTTIEFENLDIKREELLALPIFERGGAAPIFLDDTQKHLTKLYQEDGYFLAEVEYEISGPEYEPTAILFKIHKGRRHRLRAIRFQGNVFAQNASLQRILSLEEAGVFSRGEFTSDRLRVDFERIRRYYDVRGFRDVEVEYEVTTHNPHSEDLVVIFHIREGPRYFIEGVSLLGNEKLATDAILSEIQGQAGTPFSTSLVAEDRSNIIAAYENEGYRQVTVQSQVAFPEPGKASVTYSISEGEQSFIEHVFVAGNLNTRGRTIEREIEFSAGEPLSLGRILQTETNLYDLGVFERVQVSDVPTFDDMSRRNVFVQLEEAEKYTLLYGIGYSSFEGPRGTFGITDTNFLGRANPLSFSVRAGPKRQRANVSYNVHRLFGEKLPTLFSLSATNEEATEETLRLGRAFQGRPFDEFRLVASAQTERVLSRRESFFFRYHFERVEIDVPPDLALALELFREQERLRLSSFSASYFNESRDDPTKPRSGFLLTGDTRVSSGLVGSDEDFVRFLAQGQYYQTLFPDLLLASALRIGVIGPFGRTAGKDVENPVPISERFFSGGATSLRGLPQDLAGPLLRDSATGEVILVDAEGQRVDDPARGRPVPLGGNALLIANVELRFPLFAFLSGALFYDVGNVFRSFTDISSAGFSNAVGFGIHVNTPVGPIRFDIAYNPTPPGAPGFNRWNFHLSLGQLF